MRISFPAKRARGRSIRQRYVLRPRRLHNLKKKRGLKFIMKGKKEGENKEILQRVIPIESWQKYDMCRTEYGLGVRPSKPPPSTYGNLPRWNRVKMESKKKTEW